MNRLASPASNTLPLPSLDPSALDPPSLDPNENYLAANHPAYSVGTDNTAWETPLFGASPQRASDAAPTANFTPVHYESRYSYPLMVWLHGQGGHETHLHQVMPLVSMRNYVAVAPRGTMDCSDDGYSNGGYSNGGYSNGGYSDGDYHREEAGFGWSQSPAELPLAEDRVFQAIDFARQKYNLHTNRIFIAGYGSGGTMAIRMAWKHPHLFAGAASIAGPLPKNDRALQNLNRLRTLPLLLSSGREAKFHSETDVCHDLKLLHTAGLQVAMRQYPCGDELRTSMLADLDRWIMDVINGTGATVQA